MPVTLPADLNERTIEDAAVGLARAGWFLFPCIDKMPLVRWRDESSTDIKTIVEWFTTGRAGLQIGVDCGKSGLVVVDVDRFSDEIERLLSPTLTASTSRDRAHYIYRCPPGRMIGNSTGQLPLGVDVRGSGGYIIAPPSIHHETGAQYRFVDPTAALRELPPAIGRLLPDRMESVAALPPDELGAFYAAHQDESRPDELTKICQWVDRHAARGASRHEMLINALPWAMRLARIGYVSAERAATELRRRFSELIGDDRDAQGEFDRMLSWSVAQALTEDHDTLARRYSGEAASLVADDVQGAAGDASERLAEPSRIVELHELTAEDDDPYLWLVPGLIEAADRIIVTGIEGGGKSTFMRQLAVQLASGVHPFGGESFAALDVLMIDAENSRRQTRRGLAPLRQLAGDQYEIGRMHVAPLGGVLSLSVESHRAWLFSAVERYEPQVLILGPLYKLVDGDATAEDDARRLAGIFDELRSICDSALLIEAHSPYASDGDGRVIRPYGASLWSRWPEFGLYVTKGGGLLRHWRGPRDERDWPLCLEWGDSWPWVAQTSQYPGRMRAISDALSDDDEPMSKAAIERAVRGAKAVTQQALDELVRLGNVERLAEPGPRNAVLHRLVSPYSDALDLVESPPTSGPRTSPGVARGRTTNDLPYMPVGHRRSKSPPVDSPPHRPPEIDDAVGYVWDEQ